MILLLLLYMLGWRSLGDLKCVTGGRLVHNLGSTWILYNVIWSWQIIVLLYQVVFCWIHAISLNTNRTFVSICLNIRAANTTLTKQLCNFSNKPTHWISTRSLRFPSVLNCAYCDPYGSLTLLDLDWVLNSALLSGRFSELNTLYSSTCTINKQCSYKNIKHHTT